MLLVHLKEKGRSDTERAPTHNMSGLGIRFWSYTFLLIMAGVFMAFYHWPTPHPELLSAIKGDDVAKVQECLEALFRQSDQAQIERRRTEDNDAHDDISDDDNTPNNEYAYAYTEDDEELDEDMRMINQYSKGQREADEMGFPLHPTHIDHINLGSGRTPVYVAAQHSSVKVLSFLLEQGTLSNSLI